jgi:thymidine kinase
MAKLYFYYSAMNAGKSTVLLQSAHNYQERGMDTLLFMPEIDTRYGKGKISSRIGLNAEAMPFDQQFNLFLYTKSEKQRNPNLQCVLVDEAQFLKKEQVSHLVDIVDYLNLPVLTYGLRSDFRGQPFEGSMYLLIWADNLIEIKTICHCGKKAIMNARIDSRGRMLTSGEQIVIGGNEHYTSLCRKHFNAREEMGAKASLAGEHDEAC